MMSEPPINSPLTYNCGMVGQLENSLMPWRTSGSSRTLIVTKLCTPQAFKTCTARPEKPHCGNWAVPFMNSTTGVFVTVSLIQVCTSLIAASDGEINKMASFYKKTTPSVSAWPTNGESRPRCRCYKTLPKQIDCTAPRYLPYADTSA